MKLAAGRPCPSCPWRRDQDGSAIPFYDHAKAEGLAATSPDERGYGPDYGAPMFACHQSTNEREFACAGWLAAVGAAHPNVRLNVSLGHLEPEALEPGEDWPELHATFQEVIEKLRRTWT